MNAFAGLLLLGLAQAPPVFRSGVEVVYVDVSVTRKDAPVSGLTAEDFLVTDNGVRQRVQVVDRESAPTTAILALDLSESVAGEPLARLRAAAGAFLRGMQARDEAALVTFNHEIELRQAPTPERSAVGRALERVEARGGTSVIDALYLCLKRRWGGGRPLVILFSDGQDTASWLDNEDVLRAARESSAVLHVVGTEATGPRFELSPSGAGPRVVFEEPGYLYLLQRAADTTGGEYWSASFERLESVFLKVLEAASARYVLSYEPEGIGLAGHHEVRVSVRRKGLKVRARREYVVPEAAER
ncbi:MAG: VWA domain-containing protein [Vicinamibacteria bacterium]